MRKLFIIGAGFSKAVANLPTANELPLCLLEMALDPPQSHKALPMFADDFLRIYSYLNKQIENNIEAYAELIGDGIIKHIRQINSKRVYPIDIEYLLTLIDLNLHNPYLPQVKGLDPENMPVTYLSGFSKDSLKRARRFMQHSVAEIMSPLKYNINDKLLKDFLSLVKSCDEIITFNYDLVLEQGLFRVGRWNPKFGYGEFGLTLTDRETIRSRFSKPSISLLKIHGSINWIKEGLVSDGNPKYHLCERTTGQPLINGILVKQKVPYHQDYYLSDAVMVMPTYLKHFNKSYELKILKKAITAARTAKQVYVLGYSLPESDSTANIIFSQIKKDARIIVVNKSRDGDIKNRLKNNYGFENLKFHRCSIEEWINSGFTSKSYEDEQTAKRVFQKIMRAGI